MIVSDDMIFMSIDDRFNRELSNKLNSILKNGFTGYVDDDRGGIGSISYYLNGELHCSTGYAIRYRRSGGEYYLYGIKIPNKKAHRHLTKFVKMGYNKEIITFLLKKWEERDDGY